jgi:uncharacterized protein
MAVSNLVATWRGMISRLWGQSFNGSRDLYEACGYPRDLTPQDYLSAYLRGGIAARIIDAFPDATWRETPIIKAAGEDENGPFAEAVNRLFDDGGVWETMQRLDLLTSLGHYGVLLFGVAGARPLTQPLEDGRQRLLYLSPHGERSATITKWDNRPDSPRFSKPEIYRITIGTNWVGIGGAETVVDVHWSRTIHVTERALDDGAIGTPRLERIWNRIMDLEKLLGGSAEVYWQNAAGLRTWNADADSDWDPKEKEDMKAELEEAMNGLRRDIRLRGVEAKLLAATPHDPSGHVDGQLDMISGSTGIPKRILIGSERGELSSEQDENNWAGRIAERRERHAGPKIIVPVVDRFIRFGILPKPAGGTYDIEWPDSDALGEEKRAEIALSKSQALQAYMTIPGSDQVVPVEEFRGWVGEEPESDFASPDLDLEAVDSELDETDPAIIVAFKRVKANALARPLYVRRNVLNADAIRKWAKKAGFTQAVEASEMHVTIAYSKAPVDWISVGQAWGQGKDGEIVIPAGGPRVVEPLGDGAIVLMFASSDLAWRHEEIRNAGASWDWPSFQPHITITYEGDPELRRAIASGDKFVEPYRGEIQLGPEIFEEITDDWSDTIVENAARA